MDAGRAAVDIRYPADAPAVVRFLSLLKLKLLIPGLHACSQPPSTRRARTRCSPWPRCPELVGADSYSRLQDLRPYMVLGKGWSPVLEQWDQDEVFSLSVSLSLSLSLSLCLSLALSLCLALALELSGFWPLLQVPSTVKGRC